MKRKKYFYIRLLNCVPILVTKEYFDWFKVHGNDPDNNIEVIITSNFPYFSIPGSLCAYQIKKFPVPEFDS